MREKDNEWWALFVEEGTQCEVDLWKAGSTAIKCIVESYVYSASKRCLVSHNEK